MKLNKQPVTEVEYWEAIEALGGFIWGTNHELGHGRIEDKDGSVAKEVAEASQIQERLVTELNEKFRVIHPKDCPKVVFGQPMPTAPEGKTYYWDWYSKMKRALYNKNYEALICSACPHSKGLDHMISLGGVVPCEIYPGMIYRLSPPHKCGMLNVHGWDVKKLHASIIKKKGPEALEQFLKKEQELKLENTKAVQ